MVGPPGLESGGECGKSSDFNQLKDRHIAWRQVDDNGPIRRFFADIGHGAFLGPAIGALEPTAALPRSPLSTSDVFLKCKIRGSDIAGLISEAAVSQRLVP